MRGRTTNVSRNDNSRLFIRNEASVGVEVEIKHVDHYEQSTLKNKKKTFGAQKHESRICCKIQLKYRQKK